MAIRVLKSKYPGISFFAALICHKDGVCCLPEEQLNKIFDGDGLIFSGQRVSVSRKSRGSYHISGTKKVATGRTVPQNAWPNLVIN